MSFTGKVALVTGARRGIGFAIARTLGLGGAFVALNDIGSEEELRETVEALRQEGIEAQGYVADVTVREEIRAMVEDIIARWGHIDILVNNAGITRDALFVRMKDEDWKAVLDVCLQGTYNCTKEVLRYMMKQRYGRIINISSVWGLWETLAKPTTPRQRLLFWASPSPWRGR